MTVQAMKAGAVDFLTKLFDDEGLLHVIRRAIARYRTPQQQCQRSVSKANMKEVYPFCWTPLTNAYGVKTWMELMEMTKRFGSLPRALPFCGIWSSTPDAW